MFPPAAYPGDNPLESKKQYSAFAHQQNPTPTHELDPYFFSNFPAACPNFLIQQQDELIPSLNNTSIIFPNSTSDHHQIPPPNNKKGRKRTGKKDRHSKICTAQGVRDRRMRLSLQVARKFFDLQDMLGYDKASKTIEWLFSKSKKALNDLQGGNTGEEEVVSGLDDELTNYNVVDEDAVPNCRPGNCNKKKCRRSKLANYNEARESRERARARARCRTRQKMMIKLGGSCTNERGVSAGDYNYYSPTIQNNSNNLLDMMNNSSDHPAMMGFIGNNNYWDHHHVVMNNDDDHRFYDLALTNVHQLSLPPAGNYSSLTCTLQDSNYFNLMIH